MSSPRPSAPCPRCGRMIELDDTARLRGHWDTAGFSTEECPGSGQYTGAWPAIEPPRREMPWWAELILEQLTGLRGDHRAAERLARATREALDALDELDAPGAGGSGAGGSSA